MTAATFTQDLTSVASALNSGALAIVPTDTVYGLAASIDHPHAIARIFDAKDRPSDKPIPILVDSPASADRFIAMKNGPAELLMNAFWPGPLTIIFPAAAGVPIECLGNDSTVGLRIPNHRPLQKLISLCGGALAVTSANRSGEPESSQASTAFESLSIYVDIVFDCGTLAAGKASTVVDPFGREPRILRQGAIEIGQILTATVRR